MGGIGAWVDEGTVGRECLKITVLSRTFSLGVASGRPRLGVTGAVPGELDFENVKETESADVRAESQGEKKCNASR